MESKFFTSRELHACFNAADTGRHLLACLSQEFAGTTKPQSSIHPASITSISSCEYGVKKVFLSRSLRGVSILATLALTGCGVHAAKDFGGSWKSVNRYQSTPTEIPLAQPYAFFATPMDGTLKGMLTRWSKDTGTALSYQLHSDFTLFTPVSQIHTSNIRGAAEQLTAIYALEGVSVTVTDRQILVGKASAITAGTATDTKAPSAAKPAASASTP